MNCIWHLVCIYLSIWVFNVLCCILFCIYIYIHLCIFSSDIILLLQTTFGKNAIRDAMKPKTMFACIMKYVQYTKNGEEIKKEDYKQNNNNKKGELITACLFDFVCGPTRADAQILFFTTIATQQQKG